ncbi:MAG TPA: amidohydrolase family protein [Kofleriaceae bacterium]
MPDHPRILDADRHVIEPIEMWRRHLPPEYRDGAPTLQAIPPDGELARALRAKAPPGFRMPAILMLDGKPVWAKVSERALLDIGRTLAERPSSLARGATPHGHTTSMDDAGIDVAFLYPSFASYLVAIDDMAPDRAAAFARAYTDWLAEFCRAGGPRLRPVAIISRHDPATMVDELARVVELGFRAVVLRPNPIKGRTLGHPDLEPFYAACERGSIAVGIHDGTHARVATAGADRFDSHFALHACSHPMEQMMAFLALLEGGVLERHPALRVGFLEAGCGWVPYWLCRLDELAYKYLGGEVAEHVRREPSAYFRRQCFVTMDPFEGRYVADIIAHVGADRVLFSTDFPHPDHDADLVPQMRALAPALGEPALRCILWDNAARFYGLESTLDGDQKVVNG